MRFIAKPNSDIEGWDIVDTGQVIGTEDQDNVVVMTVWDGADVQWVLDWLNTERKDV